MSNAGLGQRRRAALRRREAYARALAAGERPVAGGHLRWCDRVTAGRQTCSCGRAEWVGK